MVNRLLQPQEVEVFYVLPALRRELTLCMKAAGKTQKAIAKLLGVTEPAVSQYMSDKRAAGLKFDAKLKSAIKEATGRINDEHSMIREMQGLLKIAREEKVVCKVHAEMGDVPENCNLCFEE